MSEGENSPAALLADLPIHQLLGAAADHQRLLSEVHEDAHRIARGGARHAYLVDFDLLYAFMWPHESGSPTANAEAAFLFSQDERFIIGPGTLHELEHSIFQIAGERIYGTDSEEVPSKLSIEPFMADMEGRLQRFLDDPRGGEGVKRLNQLLEAGRFILYSRLASVVDLKVFDEARSYLAGRRRGNSRVPLNVADALNCAAVSHLRAVGNALESPLYPYLLTGTHLLWDLPSGQPADQPDAENSLSRSPRTAIYASLLLARFAPREAADYTTRKAFDLARVNYELRNLPQYFALPEQPSVQEADKGSVTMFRDIAAVFEDPLLLECQRALDNLVLADGANLRNSEPQPATARYLIDQMVQLGRLLRIGEDDKLWQSAYHVEDEKGEGFKTSCVSTQTASGLEDEFVFDCSRYGSGSDAFYVFRWPSRLDAHRICRVISRALLRHDVDRARVLIGSSEGGIVYDDVDLPLDWHDIADALSVSPQWIRVCADSFDIYADLQTPLGTDPMVGVFVDSPNPGHVAELMNLSSSRYLLAGWARALVTQTIERTTS